MSGTLPMRHLLEISMWPLSGYKRGPQSVCGSLNHWHQVPGMKVDFCSKVVQLEWPVHL